MARKKNSATEGSYESMAKNELVEICRNNNIKNFSKKTKEELIRLIEENKTASIENNTAPIENKTASIENNTAPIENKEMTIRQDVICADVLSILPTLEDNSAQIIIADPPYNIGKDFGNKSDKQSMDDYLSWTDKWITECLRVLKSNGTMFIYGFSETLALILARVPMNINRRWIIWHYTNKNVASLHFWQRSHESILVLWKDDKVFHRDEVREAYTDGFLHGAAGKERAATKGRFSNGNKATTYNAHPNGALPRDVIKIPALAGGAGMKERVDHPTQKPLALCEKLLRSCKQGPEEGYVFVPFAGSGSECVAAKNLGLPFIGVELNEDYVKLIQERLQAN